MTHTEERAVYLRRLRGMLSFHTRAERAYHAVGNGEYETAAREWKEKTSAEIRKLEADGIIAADRITPC